MKLIIAGGRDFRDMSALSKVMHTLKRWPSEIVCGGAIGADALGATWARGNKVKIKKMKADWEKYGRSAGHLRNAQMADYGDALLAFWDGHSRGTENMISEATRRGIHIKVVFYTLETFRDPSSGVIREKYTYDDPELEVDRFS